MYVCVYVCVCLWKLLRNLLLLQSHLLSSRQSFAQKAELILQDCHLHCSKRSNVQFHIWKCYHVCWTVCRHSLSVFVRLPANDEGSACAGLNTSSCTDSTWGLNARWRDLCQTVNVCINAYCTALPVFTSHVHQHHNIPKVQSSIFCHRELHLETPSSSSLAPASSL